MGKLKTHSKHLHRVRRSYDNFNKEIAACHKSHCTLMRCTVGPLNKNDNIIFKIRSRLFTKTQVEVSVRRPISK